MFKVVVSRMNGEIVKHLEKEFCNENEAAEFAIRSNCKAFTPFFFRVISA